MPSCVPSDLTAAAAGFLYMDPDMLMAIRVRILCGIINGETMTCDPATLAAEASCIKCGMDARQLAAVEVSLLCQLAGGGGGGTGGVTSGAVNPVAPPAGGNGFYYNTATGLFFAWNPADSTWDQLSA